ncbi:hypothetical protein BBOU_0615 [Bifidobacterium boum]|uniref:Uncharacterized protein n=1 Tax=Bifidobacterium boum TaxID=78343 RepID=A0A086ZPN6_9BIFI|nr:hypothetical protein BBOU_0615 [Bifidobacterium boum]
MRGEHRQDQTATGARRGSSPHARGTLRRHPRHPQAGGIIPACAGNTDLPFSFLSFIWDHPRMRGEHTHKDTRTGLKKGSSPHARGTPSCAGNRAWWSGIIPACAGNTSRCISYRIDVRDHPRMRGEHTLRTARRMSSRGSSPHARGTPHSLPHHTWTRGIIPACAGNTPRRSAQPGFYGDHPRMRGEHSITTDKVAAGQGSSPHARGTL